MAEIRERTVMVGDVSIFLREADPPAGALPTLYVHGNPTSSGIWTGPLELTGGLAPDLPGWGRSAKPSHIDYSAEGLAAYLSALVESEGLERFNLVVHDWGALALAMDRAVLERVERLVIIDAVPLFDSYHWHWVARVWRVPGLGELSMGFTTRRVLGLLARRAFPNGGGTPNEFLDLVWAGFDQGTQRAILKLYRSADPEALAAAGARLDAITAPALVIWGKSDPFIGTEFAQRYADAVGGPAEVELVDGGHWPWLDRPDLVARITHFLGEGG